MASSPWLPFPAVVLPTAASSTAVPGANDRLTLEAPPSSTTRLPGPPPRLLVVRPARSAATSESSASRLGPPAPGCRAVAYRLPRSSPRLGYPAERHWPPAPSGPPPPPARPPQPPQANRSSLVPRSGCAPPNPATPPSALATLPVSSPSVGAYPLRPPHPHLGSTAGQHHFPLPPLPHRPSLPWSPLLTQGGEKRPK